MRNFIANYFALIAISLTVATSAYASDWRGLVVAQENRCSPYDKKAQYPYSQSLEDDLTASMGGRIYGPYTGRTFASDTETDIEHIVATSEAHDSGLCSADAETQRKFASDLLNLTLAGAHLNRYKKVGKDASEWLPDLNQCWFADRVLRVRVKYSLTIDQAEADVLDRILSNCTNTEMIILDADIVPGDQKKLDASGDVDAPQIDALGLYDDNGNGRITCAEARKHSIAPVTSSHPAYEFMSDSDGDGRVCE